VSVLTFRKGRELAIALAMVAVVACSGAGGGDATGGKAPAATGGKATGGAATGGTATGGMSSTGGTATGGAVTATGGAATGGERAGLGGVGGPPSGGAAGGTSTGGGGAGGARAGGSSGAAGQGGSGVDAAGVASSLSSSAGFKLVAPCGTIASTQRSCDHNPRSNCGSGLVTFLRVDKTLGGTKGKFYEVKLHFRGILEMNQYAGGTSDHNGFYTGGQVSNASGMDGGAQYNQYVLETASPKAIYHLNHLDQDQRDKYRVGNPGGSGVHHFGFLMDYHETIRIEGGSTVSLYMLDNDCLFGRNCKPPSDDFGHCDLQTMPDIPAAVQQPLDGNFIWIDVDSVTEAQ